MANKIQEFIVGEVFPRKLKNEQGTVFNYHPGEGSFSIYVKYHKFTANEKNQMKSENIVRFRLFREVDKIMIMARFGTEPPMEFPFDPTKYNIEEFKTEGNLLYIYLIEMPSKKLIQQRLLSLHQSFIKILFDTWNENIKKENFKEEYINWMFNTQNRYTVNEMWDKAEPIEWGKEN